MSTALLVAINLSACDSKSQVESKDQAKNLTASQELSNMPDTKATEKSCEQFDEKQWVGFDESKAQPTCRRVSEFKLTFMGCSVEKNAFGYQEDAILIESGEQRIFAYSNGQKCDAALEIRQSNAP